MERKIDGFDGRDRTKIGRAPSSLDDARGCGPLPNPFNDLLFRAQTIHREHFEPNRIQISRLLSIKTGACPEDCKYCPQSAHFDTGLEKQRLMKVETVIAEARAAKESGATRFCMGAAWRGPSARDFKPPSR